MSPATFDQSLVIEQVDASWPDEVFQQIGDLHVRLIRHGVLEALGAGFVATLYNELSRDRGVFLYVARQTLGVVGFLAGTLDMSKTLRAMGGRSALRLLAAAALQLWRPALVRKALQTAGYFFKADSDKTRGVSTRGRAELLSIAVDPVMQGRGVGKALICRFEADLVKALLKPIYFVSTNCAEEGSNAFYLAADFTLAGQQRHHDLLLNVYRKELTASSGSKNPSAKDQ